MPDDNSNQAAPAAASGPLALLGAAGGSKSTPVSSTSATSFAQMQNGTGGEEESQEATTTTTENAPVTTDQAPKRQATLDENPETENSEDAGLERMKKLLGDGLSEDTPEGTPEDKSKGQQQQSQPPKVTTGKQSARDYSGLSGNLLEVAKSLHNNDFSKVAPLLKEYEKTKVEHEALKAKATELEGKVKSFDGKEAQRSYYEAENAYVLTPEFGQLTNELTTAEKVEAHYVQQLTNVKNGKEWTNLHDDGKGGIVQGPKQVASPEAEITLLRNLTAISGHKQGLQGKLDGFVNQHKQQNAQVQQNVQRAIDFVCKDIYKSDDGKKKLSAVETEMLKIGVSKQNVLWPFAVHMATLAMESLEMVKLLRNKENGAAVSKQNARQAGPTATAANSGASRTTNGQQSVVPEINEDTFRRLKGEIE